MPCLSQRGSAQIGGLKICVFFLCFFCAPGKSCQAPWDADEHEAAITSTGTYVSAGNIFWCNVRCLLSPTVPISSKSIELQFNYFQGTGPEKLREEIVIAVDPGMTAQQFQRDQVQGKLKRISPEELDHSLIMYVADLINCGESDEALLRLG